MKNKKSSESLLKLEKYDMINNREKLAEKDRTTTLKKQQSHKDGPLTQ